MPADEVHHEGCAEVPRARTGPRHAAPRKPLLTRLQVPAGKAIALAAMPTAVLMGMGLTPTLAQAKPGVPENPFQDGPCVTAPDKDAEAEAEADKKAARDADAEKKAREDAAKKAARDAGDKDAKDSDEPTGPDAPSSGGKADSGDKAEPAPRPSGPAPQPKPGPEPTKTRNPLDPLGLGDAIKDVFTPDEKESGGSVPAPSAPERTTSPKDPAKDATKDPAKDPSGTTDPSGTVDKPTKPTKPVEDTADDADKADEAGKGTEKTGKATDDAADEGADDAAEAEDPMAPDENGKKPFPCVVEKKVDGTGEQTPTPIPNQPWFLEASSLTLNGADYQGVVNLTMPDGKTKQALKYVVQKTDIGDLHQIVDGPAGKKYHVQAAKGSTSTIRDGETTMYTERISGKLFGLIPITFDPEHPPPLNIPLIHFTDVKVQQAGQFGGNLTIPGLHQSITD
ncbi:hypothetical protein JQK87_17605 [Streptomyces sp. G44]|uniref:hypothetical protein n=1 Tax=Streptomyces sp. G44 TaxID=2807632 RepID=UPI001960EFAD|nr:hypothetical protein [Streptomyces sp. G44]MBM7170184.1 hypothetical protein [Streptomyces sp. G44]